MTNERRECSEVGFPVVAFVIIFSLAISLFAAAAVTSVIDDTFWFSEPETSQKSEDVTSVGDTVLSDNSFLVMPTYQGSSCWVLSKDLVEVMAIDKNELLVQIKGRSWTSSAFGSSGYIPSYADRWSSCKSGTLAFVDIKTFRRWAIDNDSINSRRTSQLRESRSNYLLGQQK